MPGMHEQPLARREIALDDLAREVEKCRPGAAHLLEDETLAAEKAGADALLPGVFEADRLFGAEKRLLAADHSLAGGKLHRHDLARKTRRKRDVTVTARGEIGDEQTAAAQRPADRGEKAAAGIGVHLDLIVHPAHALVWL